MDKTDFSSVDHIEYYLGKETLPNLHWKTEIPAQWNIPARTDTGIFHTDKVKNATISTPFNEVAYTFNNLGYRSNFDFTDDLKNQNVILLLGCSDAFGFLLEYQYTYANILEKTLGKNFTIVNLSVAGASPDMAVRIGTQAIQHLGSAVKHVCMLWPMFSLREFVSKTFSSGVHVLGEASLPYKDWWDHVDWVSNNYNFQKNRALITSVTAANSAQYHELILNRKDGKIPFDVINNPPYTALGKNSHTAIARFFIKKIKQAPSFFETCTQS